MFVTPEGKEIFVLDGHTHFWDGSPENHRNVHGKQFIDCFYGYHMALSPASEQWDKARFEKMTADAYYRDMFADGMVDMAIVQSTSLKDFYHKGFNPIERNWELKAKHGDRLIVNGSFDPRDGEKAYETIHQQIEDYGVKGFKLYTAEWNGDSRGYKVSDDASHRCFELCEKLGVKNFHLHKGPTIIPLSLDAFDVRDVDVAATDFPNLNFVVEHCGLPRLDEFCWIAVQEANVYGGIAVALPFIHSRPRYFGEVMAELLFWLGPDRIFFGSDYAIWTPKWLIEKFMAYEIPEDIAAERGVQLTMEIKEKILGRNAAALYGVDIEAMKARLANDPVAVAVAAE